MATDDVDIRIRLQGGRIAAAEARAVAGSIEGIGHAATRAERRMRALRTVGRGISGTLSQIGGAARTGTYLLGGFATAAGTAAVTAGIKFNATMEQNQVAFTQFLGSAKGAKRYLDDLFTIAAETPFELPQVTMGARQLMAFGFSAEGAKGTLVDLADAASGLGVGAEGISQMVRALGQMRTKGVVQGDEILQLQEAGINAYDYLIAAGLMTKDEIGQVGHLKLDSRKAIRAIREGIRRDFGGMSKEQAKTFEGQISSLKDRTSQMLGSVTEPLFKSLRDDVLPELNKTADGIAEVFSRDDLSFEEKFARSRTIVKRNLGPLARDIQAELRKADLGGKLAGFVESAVPKLADAAARAAPKAARAFVNAWLEMGPWGKLLTAGMILGKLGVIRAAGGLAADAFVGSWRRRASRSMGGRGGAGRAVGKTAATAAAAGMAANIGPEVGSRQGRMKRGLRGVFGGLGRFAGGVFATAAGFVIARDLAMQFPALSQYSGKEGWGELWQDIKDYAPGEDHESVERRRREARTPPRTPAERRAATHTGPSRQVIAPALPPERRGIPRNPRATGSGFVRPTNPPKARVVKPQPPPWLQKVVVELDGRQIAESVARHVDKTKNRR